VGGQRNWRIDMPMNWLYPWRIVTKWRPYGAVWEDSSVFLLYYTLGLGRFSERSERYWYLDPTNHPICFIAVSHWPPSKLIRSIYHQYFWLVLAFISAPKRRNKGHNPFRMLPYTTLLNNRTLIRFARLLQFTVYSCLGARETALYIWCPKPTVLLKKNQTFAISRIFGVGTYNSRVFHF